MKEKSSAIVLAAGQGRRMGNAMPKQYQKILGRPLLIYSLLAFERSSVDRIVLVAREEDREDLWELCRSYGIHKLISIVAGGAERYDSVYAGLSVLKEGLVLIHDAARAMLTPAQIEQCLRDLRQKGACVMAVPVKDTIREIGNAGELQDSLDRSRLWQMQTPQCFRLEEIKEAYHAYLQEKKVQATDDAQIYQLMMRKSCWVSEGSYENIKVTTKEDLIFAEAILRAQGWREEASRSPSPRDRV